MKTVKSSVEAVSLLMRLGLDRCLMGGALVLALSVAQGFAG